MRYNRTRVRRTSERCKKDELGGSFVLCSLRQGKIRSNATAYEEQQKSRHDADYFADGCFGSNLDPLPEVEFRNGIRLLLVHCNQRRKR